jgi:peptidoglycan/LPS O-acetylase OafA/YrhL
MVLLAHLDGTRFFPLPRSLFAHLPLGYLGVSVFFVISGFLISSLLFEEHSRTGRIRLAYFYMRRTFRIFPAYYVFVAVVAGVATIGWLRLYPGDLSAALTYTMNYHSDRAWWLGHSWSLAVEEQFYLIWPLTLLLVGPQRGLIVAGAFVLIAPLIRLGLWQFTIADYPRGIIGNSFETTGDAIAIGCILAGIRHWLWGQSLYRRWLSSAAFGLVPILALTMMAIGYGHPRIFACSYSVALVCIALIVDRCMRLPHGPVGKVLNSRPFVYVGGLSYSLYLWQQLFINRNSTSLLASFPLNIVLAFALAMISFYLIERPWLRLRQAIEARIDRKTISWSGVPMGPGPAA